MNAGPDRGPLNSHVYASGKGKAEEEADTCIYFPLVFRSKPEYI